MKRFLWLFEILNFLINHDWFFWLIGKFNKSGWIKSVFLSYPANYEYAKEYAYKFRIGKWKVRLTGFLKQNGKITIMFSIFVMEDNFLKKENKEKLKRMARRVEKIRQLIYADSKTFAGILPGLLLKRKLIDKTPEADITALIVVRAVELVKKEIGLDEKSPIVILGGRGFIGKRVADKFKLVRQANVYIVDLIGYNQWPEGGRKIIINVARNGNTIGSYLDILKKDDIVINEAYPGPSKEILNKLKYLQCGCFHIIGIEAFAFPAFTQSYGGGIPCCSAWGYDNKIIVRKLI